MSDESGAIKRRTRPLSLTVNQNMLAVADTIAARSISLLRIAIGIIFLWFGALKLVPHLSPAEALAGRTILILTFGLAKPAVSVPLLGLAECLIGACLISGRYVRFALLALFVQMAGTLTPLFLLPHETFQSLPFEPNLTGQYILKNLVLIAGAIVVAASAKTRPA